MNRINWLEFKKLVPAAINTVILSTGTLEPHGVTANGADNIAPESIARTIAPGLNALIAPLWRSENRSTHTPKNRSTRFTQQK
jgi:creatinine amidohydrolase